MSNYIVKGVRKLSLIFIYWGICAGEDTDICSDLLREALEALRAVPEATLFDESGVTSIWLEVVHKSELFLQSVSLGYDSAVFMRFLFIR